MSPNQNAFELSMTAKKQMLELNNILGSSADVDNRESINQLVEAPSMPKEKFALVSNPVFRRLFFIIRVFGCLILVANTITEYTYLYKHEFSSVLFFALYLGSTASKLFVPLLILLVWIKRQVINKVPEAFCNDIDQEQRIKLTRVY